MATVAESIAAAKAAGYSDQEIQAHLQSIQVTGGIRYPLLAGEQALTGMMGTADLPEEGINLLTQRVMNPYLGTHLGQMPLASSATNAMGLTNNPQLIPGMGPYPAAERIGSGVMRGIGSAIPLMGLGAPAAAVMPAAGVAGGTEAGLQELFPNAPGWAPAAAGFAAGGLAGGAIRGAESLIGEAPSQPLQSVINDLGVPDGKFGTPTLTEAGDEVKRQLDANTYLTAMGRDEPSAIPPGAINKMLNTRSDRLAASLANDPVNMPIIRDEMPDTANTLAAARLNMNGERYWRGAPPEAKSSLVPEHWEELDKSLAGTGMKAGGGGGGVGEALGASMMGELAGGVILPHLIPGIGEFVGGQLGGLAGLGTDLMVRHAAATILDPWVRWATAGAGAGAAVGGGQ